MKTLHLNIDDKLYGTLLAMLKGLPARQIEIVEETYRRWIKMIVLMTILILMIMQEK